MKKFLLTFSLVASILATSVVPAFAAGNVTLSSETNAANVGDQFVVSATMDTSNGVKTLGFKITFDPNDFELGVSDESKAVIDEYADFIGTDDFPTKDDVTMAILNRQSFVDDAYATTYAGYGSTKDLGSATIGYEEKDGTGYIGFGYGTLTNARNQLNKIDNMLVGGAVLKVKTAEAKEATVYITELGWSDKNNTGYYPESTPITIALNGYTGEEEETGGEKAAESAGSFTDAANAQAAAFYVELTDAASGKKGEWYATFNGTDVKKTDLGITVPNFEGGTGKLGLIYKGTDALTNVMFKWN